MVANDIRLGGFPLPWSTGCLTKKIYLAADIDEDVSINPLPISSPEPNNNNDGFHLPAVRPTSRSGPAVPKPSNVPFVLERIQDTQSKITSHGMQRPRPPPVIKQVDTSSRSSTTQSNSDISDSDDDYTSRKDNKSSLKNRQNSKLNSTLSQSNHHDSQTNLDPVLEERSTSVSRPTPVQTGHENVDSLPSSDNRRPSTVHIRSLCRSHHVKISNNTTMQDLINIIWCGVQFDMERYTKDLYVLLLFNHRLHIFVEDDPNTLVTDFLSLSSPSNLSKHDSIDFYVYGLPRERVSSMYNIDNGHASLFGNPSSWYPVYFNNHNQLERSQSILLSSLYALRLYFRTEIVELRAERLAMEAQFFLQLRDYLFPPAILAFKHAIVGSMFSFEKPLLTDALIQLLTRLCDPDKSFPNEICDFIRLLFCWLLEKCNPNDETGDYFLEVRLIKSRKKQRSYFQNPVTTSAEKRRVLSLEEFDGTQDHSFLQHHVDIRSLTLYLTRTTNATPNFAYDEYVIYDPVSYDARVSPSLAHWTDDDITDLYKTMARTRDYRSFSIITRGAVTADVKNQLVLLHEGRTVALLLTQKNVMRSGSKTRQDVDHFFEIFNPLACTKEKPHSLVTPNAILDEEQELPDPRLPIHFRNNLITTHPVDDSFFNNDSTSPAHQVTVILLDRSRSMSDYRVASSNTSQSFTHIDICKIMLGRLSDNILSANEIHAIGLIELATKYKTVCPITRSREQFEKALSYDDFSGEWTCMYDATREAIRQIKTFTDSPKRARTDCKKLIVCFSDGINNSGETTIENLRDLTKRNRIVIDFISFIRDDQLKSKQETLKARQFRKLCTDSGGYVYQNLCALSDLELAAMFEQEAAVWLSKRSRTSSGAIDKPERYVSPFFRQTAVRDPPSNANVQSSPCSRRILSEIHAMLSCPSENFFVFVVSDNIAFWKVILKGPPNTPYEGRFWIIYVEFDSNYPKCAPNVRFFTPIFHVNVSGDGKICHQILGKSWCQQTKMKVVFENILDLLEKPNFDDAMSLEKAYLYKEDPIGFRRQAEIHSNEYAKNDLEELKFEHRLEDYDEQFEEELE